VALLSEQQPTPTTASAARERARTARKRAFLARQRAAELTGSGDLFFAHVHEKLGRAQELVAANAELIAAREARDDQPLGTPVERAARWRAAEQRSLEFAAIHRDRGQMTKAHFHEAAAEWLAFIAEVNEDQAAKAVPVEAVRWGYTADGAAEPPSRSMVRSPAV
jgi:hypothetical protein